MFLFVNTEKTKKINAYSNIYLSISKSSIVASHSESALPSLKEPRRQIKPAPPSAIVWHNDSLLDSVTMRAGQLCAARAIQNRMAPGRSSSLHQYKHK